MSHEHRHAYLVSYDIADPGRLRRIYKLMRGYGEWKQKSVFQCVLDEKGLAALIADIDLLIHHRDDHVLIYYLGSMAKLEKRVTSLGKTWCAPDQEACVL